MTLTREEIERILEHPLTRREFLKLPMEDRRQILSAQVTQMFANIPDEERIKEMHDMMD